MTFHAPGALPGLVGTVRVHGLDATVTIHRDRHGIPHVWAETTHDVFFGQGFATAADRLWQIEFDRLRARGTLAAVLGRRGLAWDAFSRRCRIDALAREGYDRCDADTRAMLDAHAAGINAFLAVESARHDRLPHRRAHPGASRGERLDPGTRLGRHARMARPRPGRCAPPARGSGRGRDRHRQSADRRRHVSLRARCRLRERTPRVADRRTAGVPRRRHLRRPLRDPPRHGRARCTLARTFAHVDPAALSSIARRAQHRLADWDGVMDANADTPALFAAARTALIQHLAHNSCLSRLRTSPFADEPPGGFPLELRIARGLASLLAVDAKTLFGPDTTWDSVLGQALEVAAAATSEPWGIQHAMRPLHALAGHSDALDAALAVEPLPLAGDLDCVFAGGGAAGLSDAVFAASCARYVWDLADRDAGGWVVPLGASGHPASPHFADQQRSWAAGELVSIISERDAVLRAAGATLELRPDEPALRP